MARHLSPFPQNVTVALYTNAKQSREFGRLRSTDRLRLLPLWVRARLSSVSGQRYELPNGISCCCSASISGISFLELGLQLPRFDNLQESEKHWVRCAEPASICRVGDKPTSRRQPTFSAHGHQGNFSHSSLVLAHRPSVLARLPIELDVSPNLRRADDRISVPCRPAQRPRDWVKNLVAIQLALAGAPYWRPVSISHR